MPAKDTVATVISCLRYRDAPAAIEDYGGRGFHAAMSRDTCGIPARTIPGINLKPDIQVRLDIQPLTPQLWDDLVALFERPGCSIARGCWCMFYRESGKSVVPKNLSLREARKRSLKKLVDRGVVPGLLGYRDGEPVGWVSLGPRDEYARLARSPVMKPVDDKLVWSIVCFVVDPKVRHQGVAAALLKGALAWARKNKVNLVEAYPVDKATKSADDGMWFGAKSLYDNAGFVEVARRKPTRPVVRKTLRTRP